ncbi:MAG: DEAD/DEAH box helicase family protein, partial [Candidatus Rokubacteria bacterium]|nr:DEAD/DEAH box helicase family protein [Candidatus Rokubacteria bacterium]
EAALETLRRPLYPYQREGVLRFLATRRLLLGDDMGLGKTTQAAAATHALFSTGQISRALLIVPAALKPQWRREWVATTDVPVVVVDGPPRARARIYAETERGVLVIGYEQLLRDVALVGRFDPELVILDEAQRIKNRDTKTAACVKALRPRARLALTGTPLENRISDLGSIIDFVDGTALMPSWRLAAFHAISEGDADAGVSGVRNLGQLRERLAPVMLRRVRREVISQLPERTDTRVPVRMSPAQWEEHIPREQRIAGLLAIADRRALTLPEQMLLMKLFTEQRIICNGLAQLRFDEAWRCCAESAPTEAMLESLATPKLAALRPLVEELCVTQGRKVVVFSQWRRMLRLSEWAIRDILASAGLRAGFFTGAESSKLRERALVDFHDDPDLSVLFLTDAGGVGLNLQRAASACIQLELPWNPAVMEQRIGRIHRTGQARPIDVYHLVSEDGLEARIGQLIGNKRALFSGLFEGTSDEIRFDGSGSFVDRLRTLLDPASEEEEPIDAPADGEPSVEPTPSEPTSPSPTVVEPETPAVLVGPSVVSESDEEPEAAAPGPESAEPTLPEPAGAPPAAAPAPHGAIPSFRIEPRADGTFAIEGVTPELANMLLSFAQVLAASAVRSASTGA